MSSGPGDTQVVTWGPECLDELVALCGRAFDEPLGSDDLEMLCFAGTGSAHAPDVVTRTFATADGAGAAVLSLIRVDAPGRASDAGPVDADPATRVAPAAHLQLVAVDPTRRRGGVARSLVGAAESWARASGALSLQVGAGAPFYLFSGVDTRWTAALCLFESMGYERSAVVLDLVCPTLQPARRSNPPGVVVSRVEADDQLEALVAFAREEHPRWVAEFARAGESGTAVLAHDGRHGVPVVLGAAAHSVSRLGVVGPVAVGASGRGRGVGTAMMRTVLADLSTAGVREAEIAWTSTVGFYAKACGARVGRASQIHRRDLAPGSGSIGAGLASEG